MSTKRVLVTGSSGFTGRYVCNSLKNDGFEVYGLSRSGIGGIKVDLNDKDSLYSIIKTLQPNHVVHLAGISYVCHAEECDFEKVNVGGTRSLLQGLSDCDPALESVVIASSANVYGNSTEMFVSEECPYNPQNKYAESKVLMELMVKEQFPNLPTVITRPFNYTGVGQSENFLIPKIVSAYKRRIPELVLGNLQVFRDYSDVRYVACVYSAILKRKLRREILNICSGHCYSIEDIIQICNEICSFQPKVVSDRRFMREREIYRLCGSKSHLIEILGVLPQPKLSETVRWMLSE